MIMASDLSEDMIYANDNENFEEVLKKDNQRCQDEDKENMWYHGKITRQEAEDILHNGMIAVIVFVLTY